MQAANGIFTDYRWNENTPVQAGNFASHLTVAPLGRNHFHSRYDVYMGVDVFGRGTFSGGGFNTAMAVRAASEAAVSSAIFAPGWYVVASL